MINERDMMHGRDWSGETVSGWLASEKFDGVRAYWDGQTLWTRSGRPIALPPALVRQLPTCALDGEIWAGYGQRAAAVAATNRARWSPAIRFIVFDAPDVPGLWPARLAAARARLGDSSFAAVLDYTPVQNTAHLDELARCVLARGGEGLMLREPTAHRYFRQRTARLLKLKRRPVNFLRRLLAAWLVTRHPSLVTRFDFVKAL